MTITYEYGSGVYVNLTNRCDCACQFCLRHQGPEADLFDNTLWLQREPTREEALEALLGWDLASASEIVFCGYGEPTYRLDDILWLCDRLRTTVANLPPIRLNTNGHGSLINGRDIVPELGGRLDGVSVSLNASNAADYCRITRPKDGAKAWDAMLTFIRDAARVLPSVQLSVVDVETKAEEISACRALAESLGAKLRVRVYTE